VDGIPLSDADLLLVGHGQYKIIVRESRDAKYQESLGSQEKVIKKSGQEKSGRVKEIGCKASKIIY